MMRVILPALGSLDPLTRIDYPVAAAPHAAATSHGSDHRHTGGLRPPGANAGHRDSHHRDCPFKRTDDCPARHFDLRFVVALPNSAAENVMSRGGKHVVGSSLSGKAAFRDG
jgi:hypothetical protein